MSRLIWDSDAIDAMEKAKETYCDRKVIIAKMQDIVANVPSAEPTEQLKKEKEYWHNLANSYGQTIVKLSNIIGNMPSAERVGKWIIKGVNTFDMAYGSTGYEPVYECSNCGGIEESYLRFDEPMMPEDVDFPRYCPNCGARMVSEDE